MYIPLFKNGEYRVNHWCNQSKIVIKSFVLEKAMVYQNCADADFVIRNIPDEVQLENNMIVLPLYEYNPS